MWRAKKTKPLKAKHMSAVMADKSMESKFLLVTLEGNQSLSNDSMLCIGDHDDAWQQTRAKLLQSYDVKEIDGNGWMLCAPKPTAERWAAQVTLEDCLTSFEIVAQWGKKQLDGMFLQTGMTGDYILRNIDDPSDNYIVAKKVFDNTYEWVDSGENVSVS